MEPSLSRLFRALRCSRNLLSSCCATKLAAPPWTPNQAPFTYSGLPQLVQLKKRRYMRTEQSCQAL